MSKLDEISHDVQEALEITSLVFALLAKCDMYTAEALEMAAEHLEHNVEHCKMDGYRDAAHNLLLLATMLRTGIVDFTALNESAVRKFRIKNGAPTGTNPLANKPETTEEPVEENRSTLEGLKLPENPGKAAQDLLKQHAEQGNARAQSNLGTMYANGDGVEQDLVEAVRLWRLAAEQGDAVAQTNLGVAYRFGNGVAQNFAEAHRWFRLADGQEETTEEPVEENRSTLDLLKQHAEQGDVVAQLRLGDMYEDGLGVAQDHEEAVRWFRLAAEQGNARAQSNLGVAYRFGNGVAQDFAEAARWFRLAAKKGWPYTK